MRDIQYLHIHRVRTFVVKYMLVNKEYLITSTVTFRNSLFFLINLPVVVLVLVVVLVDEGVVSVDVVEEVLEIDVVLIVVIVDK